MANHRKLKLTPDELRKLYVVQGLSQETIADQFGVTQVTVGNYLRRYRIPIRPSCGKKSFFLDEKEIREMYLEKKMTVDEISKVLGCSDTTVRHNLMDFGIYRSPEEAGALRLERNKTRYAQQLVHRGYRLIRKTDHPSADKNGYVPEHRLVAEASIGRPLTLVEEVHHINMRKSDNVIENLAVLPNGSVHHVLHKYLERIAVFVLGFPGSVRPEPLDFGMPVFWGGKYITVLDLLGAGVQRWTDERNVQNSVTGSPGTVPVIN